MASCVILWHTIALSYGRGTELSLWPPIVVVVRLVLPMFFCLSGFLVAGSLARTKTLISFIGFRVLRIVPALCVEVTLSALVLGTIFTTLPAREYFSSIEFFKYF